LEGGIGRRHRRIDIGRAGLGHHRKFLIIFRSKVDERAFIGSAHPLTVDPQLGL
jgi:hypothetical protein